MIPPTGREDVLGALFTLLSEQLSPTPFVTVSRRLKLWIDVDPAFQPALYMVEHQENYLPAPRGVPLKREWDVMLFIYAYAPKVEGMFGSRILNNLLDAVENAIAPEVSSNVLTLGGTVYRVWPNGPVRKDPGDLDDQAVALYPIKIRPP